MRVQTIQELLETSGTFGRMDARTDGPTAFMRREGDADPSRFQRPIYWLPKGSDRDLS